MEKNLWKNHNKFCILFKLINSTSRLIYYHTHALLHLTIGHCSGNPCQNGGMWIDKNVSSCVCLCPNGYRGDLCNTITNICATEPCCTGSTCTSNRNSHICTCPPGKTGSTCCTDIDYCQSNLCGAEATCISNSDTQTYMSTRYDRIGL